MALNSCEYLNSGFSQGCPASPGVKNVYLTNIEYLSAFTVTAGNVISAITLSGSAKFYKFTSPKFTSTFIDNMILNDENAVLSYEPEIKFRCVKRSTELRNKLLVLGKSVLVAIVQDNNNVYWLVGAENASSPSTDHGLTPSEGRLTSGDAKDSFAGLEITLKGFTSVPAYEVSSSIIASITSI